MPEGQKCPRTGAPAHKDGDGPGPSKPGEVVSKVTSHRIDPRHGPHTGSQDQALHLLCASTPGAIKGASHAGVVTFTENNIPPTKLTARHRKDGINTEDLDHVGHSDPLGRQHKSQEVTCVQHHTSPWTGRQTFWPRRTVPLVPLPFLNPLLHLEVLSSRTVEA